MLAHAWLSAEPSTTFSHRFASSIRLPPHHRPPCASTSVGIGSAGAGEGRKRSRTWAGSSPYAIVETSTVKGGSMVSPGPDSLSASLDVESPLVDAPLEPSPASDSLD